MRKMSELLKISSKYHMGFMHCYPGVEPWLSAKGMCGAACRACDFNEITYNEFKEVREFCEQLVSEFNCFRRDQYTYLFLHSALTNSFNLDAKYDSLLTCVLVYEAIIDKLESEGK